MIDFNNMVGHEKPIQILKNSIKIDKIGHAYLFSGREGIGKKRTAIAFAKALNCPNAVKDQNPCNRCPSCLKIEKDISPDFTSISPKGLVIKIDQIRELKRNIYFYPLENNKKIVIIDQADKMTVQAANSLLKILEEPPAFTLFILITSMPDIILPTILSRCSHLSFNPLKGEDILTILKKNDFSLSEDQLNYLMKYFSGSPGKILYFLKNKEKTTEKNHYLVSLSETKPEQMFDLLFTFEKKFPDIMNSFQEFVELMLLWFHDVLLFKLGAEKSHLIFQKEIDAISDYANYYAQEKLIFILEYLADIPEKYEKHIHPKILLENLFIQLGDCSCQKL